MKIFVDTNIFLDLILKREYFYDALLILNAVEKKVFLGVVLDITILNIDYVAKKQVADIKDFLSLVIQNFTLVGLSNEMVQKSLKIDNDDLEDTLQYLSAKNAECECIITNDKSFYKADIKVLSSSEFVEKFIK